MFDMFDVFDVFDVFDNPSTGKLIALFQTCCRRFLTVQGLKPVTMFQRARNGAVGAAAAFL